MHLKATLSFSLMCLGLFAACSPAEKDPTDKLQLETIDYSEKILSGQSVTVLFDACPVDDDGWYGPSDPLGSIKCGEKYEVSYSADTQTWFAKGLDEQRSQKSGETTISEVRRAAPPPENGRLSLWGVDFTVSEDMLVSHSKYGRVGKIISQ